nr:hypothetical protein [Mucilaginibacter sp. L294]
MSTAELKNELHEKIDHADDTQVKQLYGLMLNYFNGLDDTEEWDTLPQYQQEQINIGLAQAEAGLGSPAAEVIKSTREKYGLNG